MLNTAGHNILCINTTVHFTLSLADSLHGPFPSTQTLAQLYSVVVHSWHHTRKGLRLKAAGSAHFEHELELPGVAIHTRDGSLTC